MLKLTARQEQILGLIRDAIENTGFPPTRAEIAQTLGVSVKAVEAQMGKALRTLRERLAQDLGLEGVCWRVASGVRAPLLG